MKQYTYLYLQYIKLKASEVWEIIHMCVQMEHALNFFYIQFKGLHM
jgi:hypothetical protein